MHIEETTAAEEAVEKGVNREEEKVNAHSNQEILTKRETPKEMKMS